MPGISVIIPAFNAERHLSEALESICDQTVRDIEVIVIDDGSRDHTVREAERFGGRLDLTVLTQPNAGPAAARNAGIRRARGRYCAFLDSDDVMLPDRLEAQLRAFEADPELGLVHTDLMTFDDRGVIHMTRRVFSDPCGGMVLDRLLLDNFITTSTVMSPKQCLVDAGLFNVRRRISEDFELWLRIAARWKVGFIERPLVRYRRLPDSASGDKFLTAQCALDVIQSFWKEHPEHRSSSPGLYRQSIARHLATAGGAALARGERRSALGYLAKSLRWDPWRRRSWKSLVKALVVPSADRQDSVLRNAGAP